MLKKWTRVSEFPRAEAWHIACTSAFASRTMTTEHTKENQGRVLVVDDDPELCGMLDEALKRQRFEVEAFTDAARARAAVEARDFDVALVDMQLGPDSGASLCRALIERRPTLPVIVVTGFGTMDAAVSAIRAGAFDFIGKPFELEALTLLTSRAVAHRRLKTHLARLTDTEVETPRFGEMLGESPTMKEVFDLVKRLGDSDAPVLINGESGTGKELVARGLHAESRHREGPFVAVNCAAVPATLLESTLFGHVRGAFTDAKASHEGLFVQADHGTLFLDEIGEMALEMQSKLLRVLQERRVRPVGGSSEVPFDTRIVAATNRNLEDAVAKGTFREDLYYRINVVAIDVPPLRKRGSDVLVLAQRFVEQVAARSNKPVRGIAHEAARLMLEYDWPGNVRQLQNVVERAVALTRFDQVTVDDLPARIASHTSTQIAIADEDPEHMVSLDQLERRYIDRVLKATGGNKTQAARVLGLDRRTLYRKLERYEAESQHAPRAT
jgi:two-component system response regulator HydG